MCAFWSAFALGLALSSASALAATVKQGDEYYQAKQFSQARQAYLDAALENAGTTLTAAARTEAASCLYDMKDYEAFGRESQALPRQAPGSTDPKIDLLRSRLTLVPFAQGSWVAAADSTTQFVV